MGTKGQLDYVTFFIGYFVKLMVYVILLIPVKRYIDRKTQWTVFAEHYVMWPILNVNNYVVLYRWCNLYKYVLFHIGVIKHTCIFNHRAPRMSEKWVVPVQCRGDSFSFSRAHIFQWTLHIDEMLLEFTHSNIKWLNRAVL